jgi:hypothetical protein
VAKPLVFRYRERELAFALSKVDRSKLYGYKEVEVLDDRDRPCELATLADDGQTVVGRGGTGMGYVSADGEWCEKAELVPVDLEGKEIKPVASSFAAPVPLDERTTVDDYLQHNVRSVYRLECEGDVTPLRDELAAGAIYKFPYSYRGGLEADAGFLLLSEDGHLFLAVGNPTKAEFIGLPQAGVIVDEGDGEEDEGDMMDFDMI